MLTRYRVTNMGLKNKDGVDIKDVWNDGGIKSYLGMTFEGFPNCFMIYSPHGKSNSNHRARTSFPLQIGRTRCSQQSAAPTALSNGPTIIESQADMITGFISNLEAAKAKSVNPTIPAQEQWIEMVNNLASMTLLPLTNSWWTGANVPGKKVQNLTYVMGIQQYEATCREVLDSMKGFAVEYEDGKTRIDQEMPAMVPAVA